MKARVLFLLAPCAVSSTSCATPASPDSIEWYGNRIGEPPSGARERVRNTQHGTDPLVFPPWTQAWGTTDSKGRLATVEFSDSCCEIIFDAPPGYVPKRYKSAQQMTEDAEAVKRYTIARLGQPTGYSEWGSGAQHTLRLYWNFSDQRKKCATGELVCTENQVRAADRLYVVSLNLSGDVVGLTIVGQNDPMTLLPSPPSPPELPPPPPRTF